MESVGFFAAGGPVTSMLKGVSHERACPKHAEGPVPRAGMSQERACPKHVEGPVPCIAWKLAIAFTTDCTHTPHVRSALPPKDLHCPVRQGLNPRLITSGRRVEDNVRQNPMYFWRKSFKYLPKGVKVSSLASSIAHNVRIIVPIKVMVSSAKSFSSQSANRFPLRRNLLGTFSPSSVCPSCTNC